LHQTQFLLFWNLLGFFLPRLLAGGLTSWAA